MMWTSILILFLVMDGLIFFHELGHLLAAKWAGMPVETFSVGFGPTLFSFRMGETRYRLALIPFGGYVKIMGMRGTPEEREAWPNGFAFQPLPQRMLVVVAGVLMNALVAALIYAGLALRGDAPAPLSASIDHVIVEALPTGALGWSSLPTGRTIEEIGDQRVENWRELFIAVLDTEPGRVRIGFEDGSEHQVVVPASSSERLALVEALVPRVDEAAGATDDPAGVAEAVRFGAAEVGRNAHLIAESGRLLATGAIGVRAIGGPVEIARIGGRAFRMSAVQFFAFVAFLSLNLAVLNFLPIPVLDGGHFFLLLLEGLRGGTPLSAPIARYCEVAGATFIGCLMGLAIINDVLKLFGV